MVAIVIIKAINYHLEKQSLKSEGSPGSCLRELRQTLQPRHRAGNLTTKGRRQVHQVLQHAAIMYQALC